MYIKINTTGIYVKNSLLKARADIYIDDPASKSYAKHHVYLPVIPKEGYPGKVDQFGGAIDIKAYEAWLASLPHIWQLNPRLCHFFTIPENFNEEDVYTYLKEKVFNPDNIATLDNITDFPDSLHYLGPLTRSFEKLTTEEVKTADLADLIATAKETFEGKTIDLETGGVALDIQPESITVGNKPAISRATTWTATYTFFEKDGLADGTGTLDTFGFYATTNLANCEVATATESGGDLTTRDNDTIGAITAGSEQEVSGKSVSVVTGDMVGSYSTAGALARDNTGGNGVWYLSGDYIPCTAEAMSELTTQLVSIWGTGGGAAHAKSLSDTVTIGDSIVKAVGLFKAESSAISDDISKLAELNKSDTVAISDALVKAPQLAKADTMAVSDNVAKTASIAKSDTMAVSDTIAKTISIAKSDTITISDAFSRAVDYVRTLSDTVAITDSIAKTMSKVVSDTMAIADSIATHIGAVLSIALSDTVTISDTIYGVLTGSNRLRIVASRLNTVRMKACRLPLIRTFTRRFTA